MKAKVMSRSLSVASMLTAFIAVTFVSIAWSQYVGQCPNDQNGVCDTNGQCQNSGGSSGGVFYKHLLVPYTIFDDMGKTIHQILATGC